ncbi:type VI secretion system lipoprotein TssJ [Citrobacter freundii]|uniref:Type VI secretion system lipoprotein TssJ n=1 Tax=Citrobacter freundii TaxID=546 RepID=A0ABD7B4U7_CITFR|nr:type VI secretion system lipoprotein TssJ [Citrobacter freundii]QLY39263.1 type VI secretion system lipoprotein TssJ [Citrobacter freundii]QMA49781.1 type VI secretion system lipoprotein TssJ [Citrobacter freundii]QMD27451.1 type VI secretion system lipoprotein TssJ [Citrobacter freundii]
MKYIFPVLALILSGCGLLQSVSDGTRSAASSLFYKQIKVLHLNISGRAALNTDSREQNSAPQSVIVRIYQLKDEKRFNQTQYEQLVGDGANLLKEDLLAEQFVVVKPNSAVTLDMPMEEGTQFVAIAALFRDPDMAQGNWRLVVKRHDLDPDEARKIVLDDHTMTMQTEEK